MKKIFLVLPVAILLFISTGCKEDSTSSSSKSISTNFENKHDTLTIYFDVSGTTYTFAQSDSSLQFSQNPQMYCRVSMSSGSGSFKLYDAGHNLFYNKQFSQNLLDTLILPSLPWKYEFSIENFTGGGSIFVINSN
jgi:hypothetical protein